MLGAMLLAPILVLAQPAAAWAHAFGVRYDLPVPLGYFIAGAAATVALSFVVAALFMRQAPQAPASMGIVVSLGPALPALRALCRVLSVGLLCMVVVAGLFGTRNPEMNLAPVLVWIVWWVGLSLVVACCGNVWAALDPWRALFEWADAGARRLGFSNGITIGLAYPRRLGAWPAVLLLLLFVWIEVLYPRAAVPSQLAWMALAWSAATLLGMGCFGAEIWRRTADVFSIYFAALGRFAPIASGPDRRSIVLRPPGRGLIDSPAESFAMVGFVLAMLATVLFDGLLSTELMAYAQRAMSGWIPRVDPVTRGYVLGTASLVCIWLLFLAAYLLSCLVTAWLARDSSVATVARLFALTLIPIAIGYNVAHYASYLLVQGQLIIPLLSDPLGREWDLFGTASYYPDVALLDARFTWYLAIASIVVGHVVSIWLAHRIALREFSTSHRSAMASIPLTILMVIYTAISLLIMSEPLVQFSETNPTR